MYCEDGGQLQLQISPLFCKQNHCTDGSCGNLNHCFFFTYIQHNNYKPDPCLMKKPTPAMGYWAVYGLYGYMGYVWVKWFWQHQISFLVPLFNCNTNVWPWKMNFSNIYNDIVVKIAEDGPCAEPRSSQPLPHISHHREQTLPASQVSCWDLEKITLFLGLSVVTKVRDPEVTIINLKLCRTFGPAVAVTILEGWRKYNKLTSPASEFSLQ